MDILSVVVNKITDKVLKFPLIIRLGLILSVANIPGAEEQSNTPLDKLTQIAKEGNASAQVQLGSIYFEGEMGIEINYAEAIYWLTQAAKQNLPVAQYKLGVCYERGLGVDQDLDYALALYRAAADKGLARAQLRAGLILQKHKKNDEAANYLQLAAEQGEIVAQREWARILLHSTGVQPAPKKAIKILVKVAEKGDNQARLILAECYGGTIPGIRQDLEKMVEYLWEAASQNSAEAQSKLGYCYEEGIGIPKDTPLAVKWYQKAADQNYPQALVNLGHCFATGKGIPMNKDRAFQLYKEAADANFSAGLYNLGVCYATGFSVKKNALKAEANLLKAAESGDANAEYSLGVLYERGLGVIEPNLEKAIFWYNKSVERKDPRGARALTFLTLQNANTPSKKNEIAPPGAEENQDKKPKKPFNQSFPNHYVPF